MLAECLGTEKWFALLGKPRGTVSRVIKEAVKRAGSEFTEEALTEVAQRISDGFVMGEQSEYSAYIRELMKAGLTEAEANAEAFKEFFIKNPLKAGATGAISAAMTGAGADIRNAAQVYSAGKQISNSPEAMNSLKEAAEDVLKQNYMGRNAEYSKGLQKDISNALEASANAKGKFGAAWNAGKARAGLAELYNTPKLSINSDTVFSDLRNEERNGAAQNKIETTKGGKKYVKADRQVISGSNPDAWKKQIRDYINNNIRNGKDITVIGLDGDVLTITEDTAGKARFRNDVITDKGIRRAMTDEEFAAKLRAEAHIDELGQVSRRGNKTVPDKKNHAFATDGFNYRTAYFLDNDGSYYRVTMSVGKNGDINTIYNVGKLKEAPFPHVAQRPYGKSAKGGTSSTNSIRENGGKYNSNFNQNNKWTSERIAQLDNAVKKSRVNIIIEDIPQAEVEGNKVRQGAYYRNANTIVIDPRVSDVQIANTVLFHELAHSTEGTKYYDEFKNYIKGIKGADFITETERKMKSLGLSREEAESEAVADFVKDIFRGGTEEMNGFLSKDYTAARELIDGMKNIIDGVKMRFGVEPSSVYERAVRSFEKALAKRETGSEGIQFSTADNSEEGKSVKQQLEENADKLNSMEPVFVRNDIYVQRGNRGDNLNWILQELGTKDIRVQREGVGEIILDSKRISNSLRYLKSDGELAAYAALPDVLKNGIIIYNNPNHKNRNYSTYTIGARVVINDTPGNMGVVIRFDKGKNYYKIHRILMPDGSSFVYKNNESSAERAVPNAENALGRTPAVTAFNNSILENGEKYNSNFNQDYQGENVKNSTREVSPEEKARLLREEEERRKEYGSKGGYEGHSMSRRAAEAYSSGEKPISKWTKSEILTGIEETARDNDIDIEGIDFSKLTTEELKSKFLRNSSWHHTGSFYNATDFYEISAAAVAETTREDIERIISGRTRRQLTNAERAEKAMNEKALEEAKEVYKKIKFIYNSGVTNYKSANTLFRRYANDDLDLDGLYKKAVKKTGRAEDSYKLERVSNDKGLATVKNRILEDYEAKGGAMLFETREDAVIKEKDIRNIQSIPRKSVNDFTSADIEKTEAFARKYYNEMGNKSPFFRAWFGDWRENDTTPLKIADQKGSDRGITKNIDTGWDINVSGKLFNETKSHASKSAVSALPYLDYINSIVENAVLLDSSTIPTGATKSNQSAMMHSLYAIADMGNGRELLKLYVEEINDVNQDGTIKRAYQLQNIQKAAPASVRVQGTPLSSLTNTGTAYINNISQLFAAVKRLDKNFQPRESSKVVNDDGTPRRMYYTTYHSFGTSDAGEILKRIDTQNLLTALQKINEEAIGDLAEAVELYNKVNNTDFDGIIKPTFMNNIIASAL